MVRGSNCRTGRFAVLLAALLSLPLAGCFTTTYQRGFVMPENALEQVPVGSTQEQVLIVLGTPSTVATLNGEVFYYISQKAAKSASFLPEKINDQRVLAIYFDTKTRRVQRVADYGMQDGQVFDFVSRTTASGGENLSFLRQVFSKNRSS